MCMHQSFIPRLESNLNLVCDKHCSCSLRTQKPVILEQDLLVDTMGIKIFFCSLVVQKLRCSPLKNIYEITRLIY